MTPFEQFLMSPTNLILGCATSNGMAANCDVNVGAINNERFSAMILYNHFIANFSRVDARCNEDGLGVGLHLRDGCDRSYHGIAHLETPEFRSPHHTCTANVRDHDLFGIGAQFH